ncbi:hypothetical protein DENIS_3018 [Desulfonema ishimotonii]|uniref:CoA-binding domain-containing protein n=1 Tax=Desulfonema ishimotonii TaxID=45657 RepID=A0A401FYL8_9BACT|nr:acetate--CoA ligase family protein [Desulfonema ishimotonii]GBC62055.1 hypothetical protein DENIS_3018 [Desulfonema ishimotonii]
MLFSKETLGRIDRILDAARSDGREILYEHEIYRILKVIGLETPRFVFVEHPDAVDDALLHRFNHRIVLKIVSPDIAHKQKLGGVRKVRNREPLFIQFLLHRMREEVLSHFPDDDPPDIRGFLLTEYIPHTQALGYEVLLGFREDDAFGPVLTLSKGGEDAEFFARYYDPANLFLPPLDTSRAMKLVSGLNIRYKFEEIGHPEYLEHFATAASLLSRLAWHYSFVAAPRPRFIIRALDINPFVITADNRFVAVDGFARFAPAGAEEKSVPPVNTDHLEGFFAPDGIAVVGVSANPDKSSLGRIIARQLHDMGRDDLWLLNPRGGEVVFDRTVYPLYRNLSELPRAPDLLVYAAPARYVENFLRHPGTDAPKAVILIPGIPSDMDYAGFTARLDAITPGTTRIIGPNCMGVFHAPEGENRGVNTLFIEEERLDLRSSPRANTVLLTQSGAFSVTAIDKFQNSGLLRSVVSFGNKYDVKLTDLMAYFADRPGVDLLALYAEGLDPGEGRQFFQLARSISKPIIVYKAGKTDAGAKVTASHTASMSGSYDVFRAACRQAGVILVENIETHYDLVRVFSLMSRRIPVGSRVAGVVNAGFESAVGADALIHLRQADLAQATAQRLRQLDTTGLIDTGSAFLDITPMADDRMYADFVEAVLGDPNVDCVFVSVVPHTNTLKTLPDTCRDLDSLANRLVALSEKYPKPMVISVNAGRYYQDFVSVLEENGLPVYSDIRSAITSLDRFVAWHLGQRGDGAGV